MDPISAFGLAVNILTVIDLSAKVISTASEIRSYRESITTSDRAAVAQHFESRCEKLIESSKTTPEHSDGSINDAIPTEDDVALRRLAEEANDIARDIQRGLVRRQKGQTLLKTLRDAVLSIWGEREMKEKTERLKEMRAEIQFGLMVSVKASVDAAALREDQTSQKLDDASQQIIGTLLSDNYAIRSDMERRVENLNQEVVNHFDRASHLASQRHDELLNAIVGSGSPAKSTASADPAQITNRILGRLWFTTINDRYEDILPAHEKTFEWIFSRDLQLHSSSTFIEWIENGRGVYWMSGRAGSGKSTLMKYMADDSRTEMWLRTWARGQPLVTATYLFWDLSSDILQKSLDGLFRGILHKIIGTEPSFAPLLFPDQFQKENGWSGPFPTSNGLKRAFERLGSLESSPAHVALLIDGLDEYSAPRGAQHDLAETLKRAACSKHMKIIASSRPETVFEKAFSNCEKLYLHNMTRRDRTLFVSDKLYGHQRTSYLASLPDGKASIDNLIRSAVERSEGIFLWLRLVVEALIQELDFCESVGDLQSILTQFPRGLEKLFLHMMRRMLRENERRGFECLWIMHRSLGLQYKQSPYHDRSGISRGSDSNYSFKLTAFCMDGAQLPLDTVLKTQVGRLSSMALEDTVMKVENRIRSWCAGLLELKPAEVHTLRGESKEPEELVETSFDVDFMLMKGLLLKLKRDAISWTLYDTGRIWVFVELIMRLAQFANEDKRQETHALLSELDRSMTSVLEIRQRSPSHRPTIQTIQPSGTNHWTSCFPRALRNTPTPLYCSQRSASFLSIAVENGLAEFVLDTLDSPEIRSLVKAAMGVTLLNSACRPPPFSFVIPGTIRPAIIHRLLDFGADPNQVCNPRVGRSTTPWKSMLTTVTDLEIMTVEGARQLAELLTAMIQHGADQSVHIRTKKFRETNDIDFSSLTKSMPRSPDNSTASQNTSQNDWEPGLESLHLISALSEVGIEASIESEEEPQYAARRLGGLSPEPKTISLSVQSVICQAFITKPSNRYVSADADLLGMFVPFEEMNSTWEIRQEGNRHGCRYPDNCHPPKLTSSEKESIQNLGLALLQLLYQKKITQHVDSEAVRGGSVKNADTEPAQSIPVKQPRLSRRERMREMKAELLALFGRFRTQS